MRPRTASSRSRRRTLLVAVPATLALAVVPVALGVGGGAAQAAGADLGALNTVQKRLLSGRASFELAGDQRSGPSAQLGAAPRYFPMAPGDKVCEDDIRGDVKVNVNCLNITDADLAGRAQAQNETSIAADPRDPDRLVGSSNDYRRGDGSCYTYYSTTAGRAWQDSTPPTSFTRGQVDGVVDFGAARQYWQGGGDTSVAFDTKGNSYLSCQLFNRGAPTTSNKDISSALVVHRSTQNGGASWNFPARYVRASADVAATGKAPFLDKQLMTVDDHVGSPYQDRVYVTWTEFAADGSAFIYGAYSSDYAETFSTPRLISRGSPLCTNTFGAGTKATTGESSTCNENQFSQPFTGSDGALYVVWANFNNPESAGIQDDEGGGGGGADLKASDTPKDNRNQMLLARSTDGGRTFSRPVKAGDYYELPDCATYQGGQDPGRACVPEKGSTTNSVFRATNYPVGAVDPKDPSRVVVTYGSYINGHSNEANGCVPTGFSKDFGTNLYRGVKTGGACNNDILLSVSGDRGASFTGTTRDPRRMPTLTRTAGQARTDQWFQWLDFAPDGTLAASYYDRQYGTDNKTGWSDFSLSAVAPGSTGVDVTRVSSSSMPPPTQFAGTFWGDYTGLAATEHGAYPLWSDTRNRALFVCPGTATAGSAPRLCSMSAPNARLANDQELRTRRVALR